MFIRLLITVLTLLPGIALAYYPSTKIKFDNVKIKNSVREDYEDKFLDFIEKYPELLKAKDQKYKIDQACSFTIELDSNGIYLMDSIEVKETGNNIPFNLKAIEFLRQNPVKLVKHSLDEPVTVEMKYLAF